MLYLCFCLLFRLNKKKKIQYPHWPCIVWCLVTIEKTLKLIICEPFTAPPVLLDDNGIPSVTAQLGVDSSFSVMIYSTTNVSVNIYPPTEPNNPADTNTRNMTFITNIEASRIMLKVFNKTVESDGLRVLINFTVTRTDEFRDYKLAVVNNIGTAERIISILPKGWYTDNTF